MQAEAPSFSLAGKVVVQCGGTGLLGPALATGSAAPNCAASASTCTFAAAIVAAVA